MSVRAAEINHVGVVGLGIMGAGIVEVFARNGLKVTGVAESEAAVTQGRKNIDNSLGRAVSRGKLEQPVADEINDRITLSENYADLAGCQLIVEAAPEILDLKRSIFSQLDSVVSADAILATNTSSLSVSEIATMSSHPERVIGMHFFNPAPVQKLIEVVRANQTSETVVDAITELSHNLGKSPVVIGDAAGFIVNRLLLVYLNHAARLYADDPANREAIDEGIKDLAKYPMGPLALIDLIGIDTCVAILNVIAESTGDSAHRPADILVALQGQGKLGRKSGEGFFNYTQGEASEDAYDIQLSHDLARELLNAYVIDAEQMATSGYASRSDIDTAMKLGCALPVGPFELTV